MFQKNKSGMTTVEMIVVISLVALMIAIVIPILNKTIKAQKNDLYNVQIENIKKGAIAWGSANIYLLPSDNGDSISVMLGELKSKGFVEKDITNPKTEQLFADNVLVVVTKKNNAYLYNVENINSDQTFDKDAPYIILNGSATEYVEIRGTYVEKGAHARDKDGKQITSITTFIKKNGSTVQDISTSGMGTYVVTYVATDISNGKSSSVSRNVVVRDTIVPILMVNGINANQTMIVKKDSTFNSPTAAIVDNSGETITPTIKGTVNTAIEGSYDLTYEAKDKNNNISRLMLTILVKNIVNNIFINYSASTALWTNQDVTMTISPVHDSPLASQAYSFDGGSTWQASASKAISSNQTVRMQARDRYQLISDVVSYNITNIDKTLPTCNITGNPTSWVTDATLTITGSDGQSGVSGIMLPGGSEYLSVESTTFTATTNGTFIASVKDTAGNTNTCSVTVTKVDDTSPTCNITGNPTSWVTGATLTISGSDSQSGVVGIKKPGDSDYTSTTSTTFNVTSNGTYTAYVKDAVDRIGTCNVDVTKVDDTNPSTPTISLKLDSTGGSTYTSGTWTNHTVVQIPTSTDADSGINKYQYSTDTTNWYDMSNPRSITTEENQTYYVRAIDNVGHISSNSTSHNIRIDKTGPSCSPSGGNASWRNTDLTLTGTCSDTGGSGCVGNVTKTYSSNTNSTTESPGNVSDNAGNSVTCSANQTVKIDKTGPSCTSSGGSASWRNTDLTLTGTCSDTGGSGCVGNVTKAYSSNTNSTTESPGDVSDNAGNSVTCSANQTVKIDKTAPTCASSGGSASWRNTDLTLTGTCSDTGGSGCVGNATKTYSTYTNSTAESPGSVNDTAGNSVTCSADQTVKVDKTAPVLTTPAAITLADNQVAAFNNMTGASATDNSGLTPSISVSGTVNATAGTYTLTYTATDAAGNTATGNRTVTVIASVYTFTYTGASQTFNVPLTGNYLIQVWGAEGGSSSVSGTIGGKGGYATGYKSLTSGSSIYIYVGGVGATTGSTAVSQTGGWNGGGSAYGNTTATYRCGTGGGATDVRSGGTALANRIIVAGGGGGSGGRYSNYYGGAGGGTTGIAAAGSGGAGGTASAGGSSGGASGTGGNGSATSRGGGGGGYYGGGAAGTNYYGGGGGSSYTGGVTSGSTIAGNASMPNPAGGTMTGRTGSGYAILTIQP